MDKCKFKNKQDVQNVHDELVFFILKYFLESYGKKAPVSQNPQVISTS